MNKTLLLVEDESIIAMSSKSSLERYGYTVFAVHHGDDAMKTLREHHVDLILMDINLGHEDGTEVAEEIQKLYDTPIVFLSSYTEALVVEKTERVTSYGYVVKHSGMTVLDTSIKMALKLYDANKKLQDASVRDFLTGIFNRRHLFTRLEECLADYMRNKNPFTVAILDLDHFKRINDEFGHQMGDKTLIEFCETIKKNLRTYDIFGRYGGEEFMIIFVNAKKSEIQPKMESILNAVRGAEMACYNNEDGTKICVTFSCGVADTSEMPSQSLSVDKLVELADRRLYLSKERGRNNITSNGE